MDDAKEFLTPQKPHTITTAITNSTGRTKEVIGRGNAGTVISMRLSTGSPTSPLRRISETKETGEKFKVLKTLANGRTIVRKMAHDITKIGEEELRHEFVMLQAIGYPLHSTEVMQDDDGFYYFDMQRMPGRQLSDWVDNKDLPFSKRMSLVFELVGQLCDIHSRGVVHCDLKPQNTLINEKADAKKIEPGISIVDLGIGLQISDTEQLYPHIHPAVKDYGLNAEYCPPEALHTKDQSCRFGFATDTYMLVGLIAQLFGEKDPYKFKVEADGEIEKVNQPFDLSGIEIPDMGLNNDIDLRKIVVDFLNQMQAYNYKDRPNDAELLKFFSVLHQLALCDELQKIHEKNSEDWHKLQQQKNAFAQELHEKFSGNWKQLQQQIALAQELQSKAELIANQQKASRQKAIICSVSVLILAGSAIAIGVGYSQAPKKTTNFFKKNMVDFFKQDVKFSKDIKMPTYQVFLVAAALLAVGAAGYYFYQKSKKRTENASKEERRNLLDAAPSDQKERPRRKIVFTTPSRVQT